MALYDQRIDVRVDKETKMYLIGMDQDHSVYIRRLIEEDRIKNSDNNIINTKIKDLEEEIKKLKQLKKQGKVATDQVRELLQHHYNLFLNRNEGIFLSDGQNINWIKAQVVPDLKKAGCKIKERDLLRMFKEGDLNVHG